jgi:hypothetical protein
MAGKLPLHVCRLCLPLRTQLSAPSYNGKCEGGSSQPSNGTYLSPAADGQWLAIRWFLKQGFFV